jgi:hypothetical protein
LTELPPPPEPGVLPRLQAAAPWLLLVAIAWAMTGPITDPDYWWHLASGRWMWEHGSLLHADPFGIPLDLGEPTLRRDFVLKQFWLAQLVYRGVDALAGARGAIVLRALLHGAMFALVFRRLRRHGASPLLSAALVALCAHAVVVEVGYVADRPQAFTSLFLVLLLDLLDGLFDGDRRARWILPPFLVLWANLHGGFIVGDGVIVVATLGRIPALRRDWRPFAVAALAVAASGLNPNAFDAGWQVVATVVDTSFSAYWASIVETQSLFSHASVAGVLRQMPALTAVVALGAAGLVAHLARWRQARPHVLLLAVLATLMGFRAIRFVAFFAVVATDAAALGLGPLAERFRATVAARLPRRPPAWLAPAASTAGIALLAVLFAAEGWRSTALGDEKPYDTHLDPAIAFIRENGLTGRLFGEHNDGGYLLNALEPGVRVLIDGRVLSVGTFELSRLVTDAPESVGVLAPGIETWHAAFGLAQIDMVLLPGADPVSGTLLRISEVLLRDPDWEVVFADERVILFAHRFGRLGPFARSHALPRQLGYANMLANARAAAAGGHGHGMVAWMLSAAVGAAGVGDVGPALDLVGRYLAADPRDPVALALRARLLGQAPPASP